MSRYFLIAGEGDVRDISFRQHSLHQPEKGSFSYHVVVGDEKWGWVTRHDSMPFRGWSAFSMYWINQRDAAMEGRPLEECLAAHKAEREEELSYARGETQTSKRSLEKVDGFRSRMAAATYIVKTYGYWKNN